MSNLRILYNNVAESATVSSPANSSGLLTNLKSQAVRVNSTTATYILNWGSNQRINCVILPATNLSSEATITVTPGATVSQLACANTTLDYFPSVKDSSSFPYGGLSKTAVWFNSVQIISTLTITVVDNNRTTKGYPSYIDCSRILCGEYWQPSIGASRNNLSFSILDTTQTTRTDGGDLVTDRGTIHDQLSLGLDVLTKSDREQLVQILKYIGTYRNIAISVFPQTGNTRDEQDYLIYGKVDANPVNYLVHNYYSHNISITGW